MGRSSSGDDTWKKAKFVGSFFTPVCDESVYLPAIVSSLSSRSSAPAYERSQRVLVAVDECELRVKRLRLLRGSKTERTPIRLLCVAHVCVTVPELVVFVVRTDLQRYKVLAFLCKRASDAQQLIDATSDAKLLADNIVGRVDAPRRRHEESLAGDVDGGGRRFYSDGGSLYYDSAGYDDGGGGGDYRTLEIATAPRPWSRRDRGASERGTLPSSYASSRRGASSRSAAVKAASADARYYDGPDGVVVGPTAAATMPRLYGTARRSHSMTDLVIKAAGGGGGARQSRYDEDLDFAGERGCNRQASFAAAATVSRSGSAAAQCYVHSKTLSRGGGGGGGSSGPQAAESQWVYANGSGAAAAKSVSDAETRPPYAFATRSRKVAGSTGGDGRVRAIGRYNSLSYNATTMPARARSFSSVYHSPESSADEMPTEARVTTMGRRNVASSSSSPLATQAEVYAQTQARRGRQQQGSAYSSATLPNRQHTHRQYA